MSVKLSEACNVVLTCAVIVLAMRAPSIGYFVWVPILFDIFFFGVNHMPAKWMNLPVTVTDANSTIVERTVRPWIALMGTVTVALVAWMAACIAFNAMTLYLATCWIFLAVIVAAVVAMLRALRQAQGDT